MDDITNATLMRAYIDKYDFHFKKKLGQNFLKDANTAKKIVDALEATKDETILEIGPGAGALTQYLSQTANKVIAIEIDPFAVNILKDYFSETDNIEIILADILKIDTHELLAPYKKGSVKAISNLPYYITSPVIMKLLSERYFFSCIVVTMQKEVAQRLNAKPGSKDYSVFSIAVDYYATVEYLFDISANVFTPKPQVDSAVVKIIPRSKPKVAVKDEEMFFKTVKAGFSMRRKTISNCLCSSFSLNRDIVNEILASAEIESGLRAEVLDIEKFATLSDKFTDYYKK